jgi:hypothetical protein
LFDKLAGKRDESPSSCDTAVIPPSAEEWECVNEVIEANEAEASFAAAHAIPTVEEAMKYGHYQHQYICPNNEVNEVNE